MSKKTNEAMGSQESDLRKNSSKGAMQKAMSLEFLVTNLSAMRLSSILNG